MGESNASPAMGLFVFWLMLQLVLMIALLVGGIYVMYCLGRAANGLDRMASAAEEWVRRQNAVARNEAMQPPGSLLRPSAPPVAPMPPVSSVPPTEPDTSTIRPSF